MRSSWPGLDRLRNWHRRGGPGPAQLEGWAASRDLHRGATTLGWGVASRGWTVCGIGIAEGSGPALVASRDWTVCGIGIAEGSGPALLASRGWTVCGIGIAGGPGPA